MSLSTMARTSASSSSSTANSSSGPVLPSFAQTFSGFAGARSSPERNTQSLPSSHSHPHSHSFHSDIEYSVAERDHRDQDRDRDRDSLRERDHPRTEHRSRPSMHEQDTVLPPILSHQDTHTANNKKRSLDDVHRDDDRNDERQRGREWDVRGREKEGHSPPQSSHIKREPSLSPPPEEHPSQHSHYHLESQSHFNPHSHPQHPTSRSPTLSTKRRKSNYGYPLSPVNPSLSNERDSEHSYNETYPHALTRRGSVPGLSQSNPPSASSSSTATSASGHQIPQRQSPPTKRISAIGNRANSMSPHQPTNSIHPHNATHSSQSSSRSPNQAPSQPPPTSKSPSQSHLHPLSQSSQQYQSSLPSSSMTLPAPPISFSTNRRKRLINAQSQGDIPVPVPGPINTGSGSGPASVPTPGSASGLGSASAPGSAASASGTTTNLSIPNNATFAGSSTPSHPRGPPRHLTIAPHPHTRRLEPVIHSAPVNGGFFRGARDMNASAMGGVTIKGVGISSVRFRAAYHSSSEDYSATSGPGASANPLPSTSGCVHPPVTPMRIPELPPIPITPGGRKGFPHNSHGAPPSQSGGHHNTSSSQPQQHSHTRPLPPHSAGLPPRVDKESTERPSVAGDRFILDRERLILERDRSERDRGASIPIAKNGGMRSGVVLGSVNVPRTPLFSSFGQQQKGNHHPVGTGARLQHGRSVSTSNSHTASAGKYLQVPHTAGLIQPSSSHEGASSSSLHVPSASRQAPPHTAGLLSSNASALSGTTGASNLSDPKSSFLTLFSDFYDSLADSKLLKSWLHEQLVKSSTLIEQLEKAASGSTNNGSSSSTPPDISYSTGSATVTLTLTQLEDLIERRLGPVKNETEGLRRRVGELEEMVYEARESGWGRGMERSRNDKSHEGATHSSSVPSTTPHLVSLRTSPPPPLILSAAPSLESAVSNSVLRAPASAPLPLERPLGEDVDVGATSMDLRIREANGRNRRGDVGVRSRSHSRTRTRTRADGIERKEVFSRRDRAPRSRPSSKSPPLLSSSVLRNVENTTSGDNERERNVDINMDVRVDGDADEPMTTSVPEHRVSAVRLEG